MTTGVLEDLKRFFRTIEVPMQIFLKLSRIQLFPISNLARLVHKSGYGRLVHDCLLDS
jgi:hypothetical protein